MLSFGLVNIPVKLVTAVSPKTVKFHQLHDVDGARVQQKRVCARDGEEVSHAHIVKGYEIAPDQYVVVTPDELATLDPEASRAIAIEAFVELDEIDPVYFDRSYFLVPEPVGAKAYALLFAAMQQSRRVALGRFVMRGKSYLAAVRAREDILALDTMYFGDEVVASTSVLDEAGLPDVEVNERELAMAEQLIDALAAPFDPARFRDDHRERILELVTTKAEGAEIVLAEPPQSRAVAADLMTALEESLADARKKAKAAT